MEGAYKKDNTLESRKSKAADLLKKNEGKIPIIVERHDKSKMGLLPKNK